MNVTETCAKPLNVPETGLMTRFELYVDCKRFRLRLQSLGQRLSSSIRLENPHKYELDPKEINEKFPLETLSSIAALDLVLNISVHSGTADVSHPVQKQENSSEDVRKPIISGKTPFLF
ncbi:hypothetical protein Tco_0154848 [Tanacetum coccineum]